MSQNRKIILTIPLFCLVIFIGGPTFANQADKLKNELTPTGAIRAGNSNNTIPPWHDLSKSQQKKMASVLSQEAPLDIIDSTNYHQYASQLSDGLIEMFQHYPDTFKMKVYPTHRTATMPNWYYQGTYKNVSDALLSADGEEIIKAWPGITFPIPDTPKKIMWNHQTRWAGISISAIAIEATVNTQGKYNLIENSLVGYSSINNPNRGITFASWRGGYYLSKIISPSRLAGGALLIHATLSPLKHPRQAWIYIPAQRRARRAPTVSYDAPTSTSEGIRVMDELNMYNGALDRYDWFLIGKKEMLIPYNNNALKAQLNDEKHILTPYHINPEFGRYELHRVWIIKATLKKSKKHLYKQRVFYIDEDSWSILMVENYRHTNELWRLSLRHQAYSHELPGLATVADIYHDLDNKKYFIQGFRPNAWVYSNTAPDKRKFTPKTLAQFANDKK